MAYMDVLRKKAELEGRERELQETLEREISRRTVAESAASQAHQERERMRRDLDGALGTIKTQELNLRDLRGSEARYRRMFSDALSQLQGLNVQVNELRTLLSSTNDELAAARKSGRLGVILSGIAAVMEVIRPNRRSLAMCRRPIRSLAIPRSAHGRSADPRFGGSQRAREPHGTRSSCGSRSRDSRGGHAAWRSDSCPGTGACRGVSRPSV